MLRKITVAATAFVALFAFACHSAFAGGDEWKAKMIADALTAAPPAVTNDATIYAWDAKGPDGPASDWDRLLCLPCKRFPVHTHRQTSSALPGSHVP